ncbi:Phosphopantetheine adenylyltransferase [Desulfonatronum thiosulfatophilum]|uniref:Phosphopantetheine adenylyltransferase n=1 Tax=Desulfonatronum thiosulfatophilum TaxID=617002 RepID=A0A1G6D4I7_9BACT|nr:pantetheine-phosphate adenylyltransferase [Desulfonatronum thiosulfatophilum]SDB40094.1 Phosphopantetheine adenylyltransferase [Desulfonatronum thiosulfatophilum]
MEKNYCKKRIAVYPGTFDPLTNGHVSLIRRGLEVFDQVIVAVAHDTPKIPLFNLEERLDMVNAVFAPEPRVLGEGFQGLLVEYARNRGASVILRGLRATSDFEYEFQLALMNRRLERGLQTMFLMTDYKWLYISSTIIKEAARLHGDVQGLVPDVVLQRLQQKYGTRKN